MLEILVVLGALGLGIWLGTLCSLDDWTDYPCVYCTLDPKEFCDHREGRR